MKHCLWCGKRIWPWQPAIDNKKADCPTQHLKCWIAVLPFFIDRNLRDNVQVGKWWKIINNLHEVTNMGLRQRVQELEDRVGELEIARSVYDTKQMLAKAKSRNEDTDNTPTKSQLDNEIERVQKEIDTADTMNFGKILLVLNLHLSELLEMKRKEIEGKK